MVILLLATWIGLPHLQFWYRYKPLGRNARGSYEYRNRESGITFIRLPQNPNFELGEEGFFPVSGPIEAYYGIKPVRLELSGLP